MYHGNKCPMWSCCSIHLKAFYLRMDFLRNSLSHNHSTKAHNHVVNIPLHHPTPASVCLSVPAGPAVWPSHSPGESARLCLPRSKPPSHTLSGRGGGGVRCLAAPSKKHQWYRWCMTLHDLSAMSRLRWLPDSEHCGSHHVVLLWYPRVEAPWLRKPFEEAVLLLILL